MLVDYAGQVEYEVLSRGRRRRTGRLCRLRPRL